jgi:hypothetical protein
LLLYLQPYFTLKLYILPTEYICEFRVIPCTYLTSGCVSVSTAKNKISQAGQTSAEEAVYVTLYRAKWALQEWGSQHFSRRTPWRKILVFLSGGLWESAGNWFPSHVKVKQFYYRPGQAMRVPES